MKTIKKLLKTAFLLVLCVALVVLGVSFYVKRTACKNILSSDQNISQADCIIILGAAVKSDGTPSLMLKDRLDTGISLYNNGVSPKILISGDHSTEYYDEVNAMKNYCINSGVPSEDVFMDHAGLSTYDSIYRAKEIFGAKRVVIVTQKYHLYRAVFIAKSLGLKVEGVSCDQVTYNGQMFRSAREIVARTKDAVFCLFKPKPKIMGEKISLNSNGNITNDKSNG